MKIENLQVGMEFKNYKELCYILELPVLSSDSKNAQLKKLQQYCKLEFNGHKIKVLEIYSIVQSKEGNQSYIKEFEFLLMYQLMLKNSNITTLTRSQWYEQIGMCSSEYNDIKRLLREKIPLLSFAVIANNNKLNTKTEKALSSLVNNAIGVSAEKMYAIFQSAVKSMLNRGILRKSADIYMMVDNYNNHIRADEEYNQICMKCIYNALRDLKLTINKLRFYKNKKGYYDLCNKYFAEYTNNEFIGFYEVVEIEHQKELIIKELKEADIIDNQNNLKNAIYEGIVKQAENRYDNYLEYKEKIKPKSFGVDVFRTEEQKDEQDSFLEDTKELIRIFIYG